jgi:hypothetical protein
VAVNADIDQLDVILIPEQDDRVNPAGIKGLGELGNVGTAAAIANVVHHATGQRIRDLPIRIDKLRATSAAPAAHSSWRGVGPLYKPLRRCLGAPHEPCNQGYHEENNEHPE